MATQLLTVKKRIQQAALQLFTERGTSDISISELAQKAGVARGTIYNNHVNPDSLFEDLAAELGQIMNEEVESRFDGHDPALRVAKGIRLYVRKAYEEPSWGRFVCRFGMNPKVLMMLWGGEHSPMTDINNGAYSGRFQLQSSQFQMALAMTASSVLSAILLTLEGHKTWQVAGSETAELILRSYGLSAEEAHQIAWMD